MYVIKITNDNDNVKFADYTDKENNIDINLPTLLLRIPCGLSF